MSQSSHAMNPPSSSGKSPALKMAIADALSRKVSHEEIEGGNPRTSEFSYKKSARSVLSFKSRENSEIDSQLAKLQMQRIIE